MIIFTNKNNGKTMASYPNEKAAARYAFSSKGKKLRPRNILDGNCVFFKRRKVVPSKRMTQVELVPCFVSVLNEN